jgi:hypothetical protein
MAIGYAAATRNAILSAIAARADADAGPATIKVYSGTRPVNADTAPGGGNTLLLTFTLAVTAFTAPDGDSMDVNSLPIAATGLAAGTGAWFRLADESGDVVFDGNCGATGSGQDIEMSTTTVSVGLAVNLTGGTLIQQG